MEKFPQKKSSSTEKMARAALAGAAMMGAVGAAEPAAAEQFKPQQRVETQQSAIESNAAAFLNEITNMPVGFEDAQGRNKLRTMIQIKFDRFVAMTSGASTVTLEARANAAKMVLEKMGHLPADTMDNPSLNYLEEMLKQYNLNPNQQKSLRDFSNGVQPNSPTTEPTNRFDPTAPQPSEIKRSRTNW
jgi:hypothetical protein